MQTTHFTNHQFNLRSLHKKLILLIYVMTTTLLIIYLPNWQQSLAIIIAINFLLLAGYWLIKMSRVSYTLTATHFQQHRYKGGWVVKWNNISKIGICHYEQDGWFYSLPWIGIKLKCYSPYLDSICPRLATEILINQRALLYIGTRQQHQEAQFEDIVLDSRIYQEASHKPYTGLMAMLANRMKYQRKYYDYDVFISVNDLNCSAEEFVGLARRYLAAAEPNE